MTTAALRRDDTFEGPAWLRGPQEGWLAVVAFIVMIGAVALSIDAAHWAGFVTGGPSETGFLLPVMLLAALWGFVSAKLGWPRAGRGRRRRGRRGRRPAPRRRRHRGPRTGARPRPDGPLRLRLPLLPRPRHRRRAVLGDLGLPAGARRRHVDGRPAGRGQPLRAPPRSGGRGHDRRRHLHRAVGLGAGPVRLPGHLRRGRAGAPDAPEPARPAGRLGAPRHRRPGRRGDPLHAQRRDLHRADPDRRPGPDGDRQLGAAGGRPEPAGRARPAGQPGGATQHARRRRGRQRPRAERALRHLVDDHRPLGVLVPRSSSPPPPTPSRATTGAARRTTRSTGRRGSRSTGRTWARSRPAHPCWPGPRTAPRPSWRGRR